MVRFYLNQQLRALTDIHPNLSVLDYLRLHEGRCGTKEGCASGDCGACTVVIVEPNNGTLRYQAINACITPLGNLHGKQLLSVEDLQSEGELHPAQQALVDCHGSQCGFCTPGFVMSLLAYRQHHTEADRASLIEALGGNLCRCTGYRPILDAGVAMYASPQPEHFSARQKDMAEALELINSERATIALHREPLSYYAPASTAELAELLERFPQAKMVAGGTDLSLEMTQFLRSIEVLVYTGRIPELIAIEANNNHISIGAAVTYTDLQPTLCGQYPELTELIERLGSHQIRNQGTLGGNVANASPIGDMPPVLIALGANLVIRSNNGMRTLPIEAFFTGYKTTALTTGEFIQSISIPNAAPGLQLRAYKISKRLEDDISALCGVFLLGIDDGIVTSAAVAFGGMAEIPKRARACEDALLNQPWNKATISAAKNALSQDFTPIDDFRASAHYRMQAAQNLLERIYLELSEPTIAVRVGQ